MVVPPTEPGVIDDEGGDREISILAPGGGFMNYMTGELHDDVEPVLYPGMRREDYKEKLLHLYLHGWHGEEIVRRDMAELAKWEEERARKHEPLLRARDLDEMLEAIGISNRHAHQINTLEDRSTQFEQEYHAQETQTIQSHVDGTSQTERSHSSSFYDALPVITRLLCGSAVPYVLRPGVVQYLFSRASLGNYEKELFSCLIAGITPYMQQTDSTGWYLEWKIWQFISKRLNTPISGCRKNNPYPSFEDYFKTMASILFQIRILLMSNATSFTVDVHETLCALLYIFRESRHFNVELLPDNSYLDKQSLLFAAVSENNYLLRGNINDEKWTIKGLKWTSFNASIHQAPKSFYEEINWICMEHQTTETLMQSVMLQNFFNLAKLMDDIVANIHS